MKTILLPTDFSSHSEKALEFAIEIAKQSNAKILVAHAYFVPVFDPTISSSLMEEVSDVEQNYAEQKLQEICTKISQHSSNNGNKLKCTYEIEYNMPILEISKLSTEKQVDLIIMGTEEKEEFLNITLGSTTVDVVKEVSCPVLIVKKDTPYNSFQKIFYALDNIKEDLPTLKQLIPFAQLFNSEITLLHVSDFATTIEELGYNNAEEKAQNELLTSIKDSLQYTNIGIRYCFADEIIDGFQRITKTAKPDLITLLKYRRNWLENIFHKSVIRQEIKKSKIPLLILHKE